MDDLDRLYFRLLDAVRDGAPHLRERRFRLGDIPQHLLPYRLHRRELGFDGVQQYERALARLAAGERGYLSAPAAVQQTFRRAVEAGDADAIGAALRQHADADVALAPEGRHGDGWSAEGDAGRDAGRPVVDAEPVTPPVAAPVRVAPTSTERVPVDAVAAEPAARTPVATAGGAGDVIDAGGLVIPITVTGAADRVPPPAPAAAPATPAVASPPSSARPVAPPAAPVSPPSPAADAADAMPFPVRPPTPVFGGRCPHCGRALPADRGVTFCPYCGENLTVRRCPACSTELEVGWRFCITCGREVDDPVPEAAPA